MTLGNIHRIVVRIVAAATIAVSVAPARAGEPSPESQARDLAAEVMRGAGEDDLGAWTRGVIGRALERAGEAERHAARIGEGLAGGPNPAGIIVFMSLSVPAASWEEWAREAARADVPLVLRGVGREGFRATVKAVGVRLGGAEAGVAIDPRLFRLFGVDRVPAVAVAPDGVPPCRSRGCSSDPPPPHDQVTGNIGLVAALEAIAAEGDAGRDAARQMLQRLNGTLVPGSAD